MNRAGFFFPLWLVACLFNACAWIDDVGSGENFSNFQLQNISDDADNCIKNAFPLDFSQYQTLEPAKNLARIMMFESVAKQLTDNYIHILFNDYDADTRTPCPPPASMTGSTTPVTPSGCVRAQLMLNSCSPAVALRIEGNLTLTDYHSERGKRVSGTIDGNLIKVRKIRDNLGNTKEITEFIGNIDGEFAYSNHASAVWNR